MEKITLHQEEDYQTMLSVMKKRRAVKNYDPHFRIDRAEIAGLLKAATLAPSEGNLQSWRFLVIDSAKEKQKLFPIAFQQNGF